MKTLFISAALLMSGYIFAQDPAIIVEPEATDQRIFTLVEKMPEYAGGKEAVEKFIAEHLSYPNDVKTLKDDRTVYVSVVVEKDGSLSNIKISQGLTKALDDEAMRVVGLMPNWIPGSHHGYAKRVKIPVAVKFDPK